MLKYGKAEFSTLYFHWKLRVKAAVCPGIRCGRRQLTGDNSEDRKEDNRRRHGLQNNSRIQHAPAQDPDCDQQAKDRCRSDIAAASQAPKGQPPWSPQGPYKQRQAHHTCCDENLEKRVMGSIVCRAAPDVDRSGA